MKETQDEPLPSQSQQQQQRYEELKWTDAPLFSASSPSASSSVATPLPASPFCDPSQATTAAAERLPLHAGTTALLVVDVQTEYWSHCPSVRQDFPEFPTNLQRTIQVCRQRQAKIIWVRADYRKPHSPWLVQFERLRGRTPGFLVEVPCDPASADFTWEDFATPVGGEVIIPKSSWSSTSDTALKEVLKASGIDTVVVCGLITSVCVQHSAFGVFEAGYRTLLVTDACADRGRARHEAALALYGDYMYELVTSRDLQDATLGLLPATAKPLWLTLPVRSDVSDASTHAPDNNIASVSPLGSFADLQTALPDNADTTSGTDQTDLQTAKVHNDQEDDDGNHSGTTASLSECSE
jgi:nicotinamidase-related amidase